MNNVNVTIKGDSEGFMLFHCRRCNNEFKLHINEFKEYGEVELTCPYCGIESSSQDMLPDEVFETAKQMIKIEGLHYIQNMFSKSLKNSKCVTYKPSKLPERKESSTIQTKDTVDTNRICPHCERSLKIIGESSNSKIYCSYCGELIWVID